MVNTINYQCITNELGNILEADIKEHQFNSNTLVHLDRRLPYSLELQTGKILNVLTSLFKKNNTKNLRDKLQNCLSARTRPGFYAEIIPSDLHLAYAHQKDGRGSQHWWRLFFTEKWKNRIENIIDNTAITRSANSRNSNHNYNDFFSNNENTTGLKEWGGMYFRSVTEIKVAEELYSKQVLFFANAQGQVSCQSSPVSNSLLPGRIEVDFLVFHLGKCMILEVDGVHHEKASQTVRDYARDRVLLREGIPTARFTADECFNSTEDVIVEFLQMFGATPTQQPSDLIQPKEIQTVTYEEF